MIRCGWLVDKATIKGGAELTEREFRAAKPDDVEIVECPKGAVVPGLDIYAINNSVTYEIEDLQVIGDQPAYRYWNDVGSWYRSECRQWFDEHTTPICCSPLQAEYMGLTDRALLIPPPVDLQRFMAAGDRVNGNRRGSVCVASWRNIGKGAMRVMEWAERNGGCDFYGGGPMAPPGSREIAYEGMPALLASYQRFVFLPGVIEPFGRVVAEAWAAGAEIVTNDLVGAKFWLKEDPDAIDRAASDFWDVVTSNA